MKENCLPENSPSDILKAWLFRLHRMQTAHYQAAVVLGRHNQLLGVLGMIFGAFVGSTLFANLQHTPKFELKLLLGLLSLVAAIFAGLQPFLKLGERAEKHRATGSRFSALRTEVEQEMALQRDAKKLKIFMDQFRARWSALNDEAPAVPGKVWQRTVKRFKEIEPDLSKSNIA